jgi:hypothetical protein
VICIATAAEDVSTVAVTEPATGTDDVQSGRKNTPDRNTSFRASRYVHTLQPQTIAQTQCQLRHLKCDEQPAVSYLTRVAYGSNESMPANTSEHDETSTPNNIG